jgi:hypothetical protein
VVRLLQDAGTVPGEMAWRQFPNVDAQQDYAGQLLQAYDASTLQSLICYAYLVKTINALAS